MNKLSFSLLLLSAAALGGCKTTETSPLSASIDSLLGKRTQAEARLSTAASAAMAQGKIAEALAHYEALYNRKAIPDAETTLNYAQLLRRSGRAAQAIEILKPLAGPSAPAAIRTEYAAALIAQGDFTQGEKILGGVLEDEKAKDFHKDAYNLMGVALDARGERTEAEQMFRQALDGWKGDASPVLNNLGLNLAGQGRFDEALTHLRRAQIAAPGREELARNVILVTELRDKVLRRPAPVKKTPTVKKK